MNKNIVILTVLFILSTKFVNAEEHITRIYRCQNESYCYDTKERKNVCFVNNNRNEPWVLIELEEEYNISPDKNWIVFFIVYNKRGSNSSLFLLHIPSKKVINVYPIRFGKDNVRFGKDKYGFFVFDDDTKKNVYLKELETKLDNYPTLSQFLDMRVPPN